MEPGFNEVSTKYQGKVDVVRINADESPEILQHLGVMSIPTMVGFAGGKEILRRTGFQSTNAIDVFFDATFNQIKPTIMPIAPIDRLLRVLIGIALLLTGWFTGKTIWLMVIGGLVIFSAFYDRCPIIKAITQIFQSRKKEPAQEKE
jgi:thioredoxin 1